ncbi:hypothetical protein P355_0100 [Burkholderia cenocepacia KC-01]|nr:hypothetical protein P355_0100 [Burkholderia cenocepacia KC-01]
MFLCRIASLRRSDVALLLGGGGGRNAPASGRAVHGGTPLS